MITPRSVAKDNALEARANDVHVGEAPNPIGNSFGLQGPPASCISLAVPHSVILSRPAALS